MMDQWVSFTIPYCDTDQMGFVHHSNYARYLEMARWEIFRRKGLPYRKVEEAGIYMPVIEMNHRFHKPLYYDDRIQIKVDIDLLSQTRLNFNYKIYNQHQELVHEAFTRLTFLKASNGRPCAIPANIRNMLQSCQILAD
ncbi:MAG: acyl-CoA thioesterase [Candidatus Cyclobacteriaceae bacterium M3_2C_046]